MNKIESVLQEDGSLDLNLTSEKDIDRECLVSYTKTALDQMYPEIGGDPVREYRQLRAVLLGLAEANSLAVSAVEYLDEFFEDCLVCDECGCKCN